MATYGCLLALNIYQFCFKILQVEFQIQQVIAWIKSAQKSKEQNMEVKTGTWTEKKGLAQMLKGGVIMDVVTAEHARIAEDAGACAVMALERVPADIRANGGVARMS